jgi:hypothetical protein
MRSASKIACSASGALAIMLAAAPLVFASAAGVARIARGSRPQAHGLVAAPVSSVEPHGASDDLECEVATREASVATDDGAEVTSDPSGGSERALPKRRTAGAFSAPTASHGTPAAAASFDVDTAKLSLASSMESLPICARGEVAGAGVAQVFFAEDGTVARVALSKPYARTATGACVARRFMRAAVPPFSGPSTPIVVRFAL